MPSALAGIRQKSTNKMMPFKNNIGYSGVVVMGAAVGGIAANGVSDTFWDTWNRGVRQGKDEEVGAVESGVLVKWGKARRRGAGADR